MTSSPLPARTLIDHALHWCDAGDKVVIATVTGTWGSSPRPAGSVMVMSESGRIEGSVSGGCVETDVITAAQELMNGAPPRIISYGVSSERAWEVGLACGGKLEVLLEAVKNAACPWGTLPEAILRTAQTAQNRRESVVLIRTMDGLHHTLLTEEQLAGGDTPDIPVPVSLLALQSLKEGRSKALESENKTPAWFVQPLPPPLRLLIVGAVHIAQHLALLARMSGLAPVVIDPRTPLATEERFPGLIPGTTLITEWPDEVLHKLKPDSMTAIVTLTHDAKLDDPTLEVALRSSAFYIGALGSRKTQASRIKRLHEAGFSEHSLKRIHGPVGLAIGATGAEEIAISILAEIIAVRRNASLAEAPGW